MHREDQIPNANRRTRGWQWALPCVFALACLVAAGCERPKVGVRNEKEIPVAAVPGATLETADKAAREFFMYLAKRDSERALEMVLPLDREKAQEQIKNPPALPGELLLTVRVLGGYAKVRCTSPGFEKLGLDMKYVNQKWYVILGN